MGMALARKLTNDGDVVTVMESESQLGGLATWQDYGGFFWDRFYHVILPTDRHLIRFISEIGLADDFEWRRTFTGFFVEGNLHSISSNMEFLKFPLLSLFAKARLAWAMVYCSRVENWQRLEQEPVEQFLLRISGREAYEKLWKPLLLAKLGENFQRVSAVFIWSYIKRLFSARDKSASASCAGPTAVISIAVLLLSFGSSLAALTSTWLVRISPAAVVASTETTIITSILWPAARSPRSQATVPPV